MKKSKNKQTKLLNTGLLALVLMVPGQNVLAGAKDDPLLTMVNIDQFEQRYGDEDPFVFEGQAWVGYDLEKVLLKAEGERVNGENESAELQLLYSKAISPFWNIQLGARRDFKPEPSRNWGVIGFQGLAPYNIEIDTALFIGQSGSTSLRIEAEYELMLTQRLVLRPEIELNFFGKTDAKTQTGSGLANSEVGLRLAYEVRREFAPYIGVNWERKYGATADFAQDNGESSSDTQFVIGFSAWF
ncbi:MAG: copper resistance protein B [Oceanospirillaceae bacterium]